MYIFLDKFFLILHTSVVLFNLFGWVWKKTRLANLILLLLTGSSWYILGIWYGIGYCPFTDWHWKILRELGYTNLPNSYIKFKIDRLTGLDFNEPLVSNMIVIFFFTSLAISLVLNYLDWKKKKK